MPLSDLLDDSEVMKRLNNYGNDHNIGSHIIYNVNKFNAFMENKITSGLQSLLNAPNTYNSHNLGMSLLKTYMNNSNQNKVRQNLNIIQDPELLKEIIVHGAGEFSDRPK